MQAGDVVAERYRIERELGAGGMGAVYLARDLERDKDVALKVTASAGRNKEEFRARFEREAAIGCALGQEKGFVRAFDWGQLPDGRTLYMAMDLVRAGQALELREGPLLARLRGLEAASERVARLHELGVVHRDLKPTNFLIDADGVTWLLDFGLAKVRGESAELEESVELTRSGIGMGTPIFMPPEQFADAKKVDPRGDVYALGVMLFVILTGHAPYEGEGTVDIYKRLLEVQMGHKKAPRTRDFDPTIPIGLDALAAEATAVDPAERTAGAGTFLATLRRASARLENKKVSGVGPSRPPSGLGPVVDPSAPTMNELRSAPTLLEGVGMTRVEPLSMPPEAAVEVPTEPRLSRAALHRSQPMPVIKGGEEDLGRAALSLLKKAAPYAAPPLVLLMLLVGVAGLIKKATNAASTLTPAPAKGPTQPAPAPVGVPPRPSPSSELERIRLQAESGHPAGMLELGIRYERGEDVEQSYAQAMRWYEQAGAKGSADALYYLGEMHELGRGCEPSAWRAKDYYRRAARLGHPEAETRALMLEQAEEWKQKAEADQRRLEMEAERQRRQEELEAQRRRRSG